MPCIISSLKYAWEVDFIEGEIDDDGGGDGGDDDDGDGGDGGNGSEVMVVVMGWG